MRATDIRLRWLSPVSITTACREMARVAQHFAISLPHYNFATEEGGTYIRADTIEEVISREPRVTTGGGRMLDATGADWATFAIDNLCERPEPGATFQISMRRWRTLYPGLLEDTGTASAEELIGFARHAAQASSADVVYSLDVGAFRNCFEHPDARDAAVLIWIARAQLRKVPAFHYLRCEPSLFTNSFDEWYVFTDAEGKILSRCAEYP